MLRAIILRIFILLVFSSLFFGCSGRPQLTPINEDTPPINEGSPYVSFTLKAASARPGTYTIYFEFKNESDSRITITFPNSPASGHFKIYNESNHPVHQEQFMLATIAEYTLQAGETKSLKILKYTKPEGQLYTMTDTFSYQIKNSEFQSIEKTISLNF